jgi:hypothetical protein
MVLLLIKKDKCVKTSVTLPRGVRQRAAAVARSHDLSLSQYVTRLLERDLAEREQEQGGA